MRFTHAGPGYCQIPAGAGAAYWQLVSQTISQTDDRDMTPTECQAWIQIGLALTPFCAPVMNTSLEWAVVTGGRMDYTHYISASCQGKAIPRLLSLLMTNGRFLCSRGLEHVLNRDPSFLCLPSQGRPLLVLPGDGMFQAQRVVSGKSRPVILHGYGGAKKEMPTSLAKLASVPKTSALIKVLPAITRRRISRKH